MKKVIVAIAVLVIVAIGTGLYLTHQKTAKHNILTISLKQPLGYRVMVFSNCCNPTPGHSHPRLDGISDFLPLDDVIAADQTSFSCEIHNEGQCVVTMQDEKVREQCIAAMQEGKAESCSWGEIPANSLKGKIVFFVNGERTEYKTVQDDYLQIAIP